MSNDPHHLSLPGPAMPSAPLRAGLALSNLTAVQLWVRYIALGGCMSESQLCAVLQGRDLSGHDYDVIAHALNEHFLDSGGDHPVAYSDENGRHVG